MVVKGKRSIGVQTKRGSMVIHDVLLVPYLDQNLLSVAQLVENGYSLVFEDKHCAIYNKGKEKSMVTKLKMKNQSFPINFNHVKNSALKAQLIHDSWF